MLIVGISYTLHLIIKAFEHQNENTVVIIMFYNITRPVTITFHAIRNIVILSNLRKLCYNIVSSIRKKVNAFNR